MDHYDQPRGCLEFTLAGVPTIIHPSSWLVLLVLGCHDGHNGWDFLPTFLFIAAGMLCLLAHEYGHAFTYRALTGYRPVVQIAYLGGKTLFSTPPRTRTAELMVVLAGPAASLLLAAVGGVALGVQIHDIGGGVLYSLAWPVRAMMPESVQYHFMFLEEPIREAFYMGYIGYFTLTFYGMLSTVCVIWSLFNLMPIVPLDGSRALYLATNNYKISVTIGLYSAAILTLFFLTKSWVFAAFVCAYFTYINWKIYRELTAR